jgi:hypothetical protein
MQEILTYIVLGITVAFLIKKTVIKSKKDDNCGPSCGCS